MPSESNKDYGEPAVFTLHERSDFFFSESRFKQCLFQDKPFVKLLLFAPLLQTLPDSHDHYPTRLRNAKHALMLLAEQV